MPDISPEAWAFLNDAEPPENDDGWECFMLEFHDEPKRTLWYQYRDMILTHWIQTKPGTRPSCWWLFDSPRATARQRSEFDENQHADMIDHRRQISGSKPRRDATAPCYDHGIPKHLKYSGEPPEFESERAYLDRHGLLMPGE